MSTTTIGFVARPQCDLCGTGDPHIVLARPFTDAALAPFVQTYYAGRVSPAMLTGGQYRICQCAACGFVWQGDVLDDIGMAHLYDDWISAAASLAKKHPLPLSLARTYSRELRAVAALFPGRAPASLRLLDFGMGWGTWCRHAQHYGYTVVGVELSQVRLAYARERGVTAVAGLGELVGQQFDFINAEQVFEHVAQPLDLMRALVALLAPGGVLRVAVPDSRGALARLARPDWQAGKDALHPLEHINAFTPRTLRLLARAAGVRPLPCAARGYRGRYPSLPQIVIALHTRLTTSATILYGVKMVEKETM